MLESKKRKFYVRCIAVISLVVIIAGAIVLNQNQESTEEIKLIFKTDIEVEKDSELTTDLLVKETNAEDVKIVNGDTSKAGEISITVEAVLKESKKEFSTKIKVKENENSEKEDNVSNDVNEDEGKNSSSADGKVSENDAKKNDTRKKSNSSNASSSKADGSDQQQNKPQDNSQNEGKDEFPSVRPEPDPVERLSEGQYASQVFSLINSYRMKQGLPALSTNGTVQSIANLRASDMASMGYASHTRPDGKVADAFWVEANYGIIAGGEDVFGGSQGYMPEAVVDSFINSSGHRAPIVSNMNKYMAVGVKYSGGQVYVSVNFQQ